MNAATIRVRTTYLPATGTKGSRIRVTWQGKQYTEPFDYAANYPHDAAAAHALHISAAHLNENWELSERNTRGNVYDVTCVYPGDNHSDDALTLLAYGRETLLPLCGFHARTLTASGFETMRSAGVIK